MHGEVSLKYAIGREGESRHKLHICQHLCCSRSPGGAVDSGHYCRSIWISAFDFWTKGYTSLLRCCEGSRGHSSKECAQAAGRKPHRPSGKGRLSHACRLHNAIGGRLCGGDRSSSTASIDQTRAETPAIRLLVDVMDQPPVRSAGGLRWPRRKRGECEKEEDQEVEDNHVDASRRGGGEGREGVSEGMNEWVVVQLELMGAILRVPWRIYTLCLSRAIVSPAVYRGTRRTWADINPYQSPRRHDVSDVREKSTPGFLLLPEPIGERVF
jgi:hypothetical protein